MTTPEVPPSGRHGRPAKTRTHAHQWRLFSLVALLAVAMAGLGYAFYPRGIGRVASDRAPGGRGRRGGRHGRFRPGPGADRHRHGQDAEGRHDEGERFDQRGQVVAGAAGGQRQRRKLLLNEPGSALTAWNQTSSYCPATSDYLADGTVGTDSGGGVTLTTSSKPGSCVALISPSTYSSAVIEAEMYYPAVPGKPGTIANWRGCG